MDDSSLSVSVTFNRPRPRISIAAFYESNDPEETDDVIAVLDFYSKSENPTGTGDKRDSTTITEKTLAAVGRLLGK